ncbi:MAG TPA: glycosyltransferase family 2 protein [Vicinamibacterales bacterium]|nr:glycosyltransferase family 2 protein [Vicinamibacterales bacterium]
MSVDDSSLAIVIVSYNVRDEIDACLRSLVGHTAPFDTMITVVDNASTDDTVAMVRRNWPQVEVIEAGANLGFARANNLGIRATRSEFVLLLNPDTIVPPGALPSLIRGLAAHPEAAAAGPRLVDAAGFPELSFGWTLGPWGELRQKLIGDLYRRRVRAVVRRVDGWSRLAGEREWVSGACLVARRADLEAVGLLDERFFMYTEDVDLCVQLRKRGRSILFIPQSEVLHLRGRSASRNPHTERLRRQSQMAYYQKHHPQWVALLKMYLRVTGKDRPTGQPATKSR